MKAIKKMLFFLKKMLADVKKHSIFVALYHAKVAQLVERQPSKLNVAGSNPVFRSKLENAVLIGSIFCLSSFLLTSLKILKQLN